MNRKRTMLLLLGAVGLCLPLGLGHLRGETGEGPAAGADGQRAGDERDAAAERSAEDVLDELLRRRAENPLIEPAEPGGDGSAAPAAPGGSLADRPADAAAGSAPLRREGQFIVTRRARMIQAPAPGAVGEAPAAVGGAGRGVRGAASPTGWMIAFESDGQGLHDPPMHLMPCRLLEEMERAHQQHGESAVFLVSGKVFVYRGANYLLPTLAQVAPDRGNLRP